MHVGWNSLLSADYSFVKAHISFQWVTPSRCSLYTKSGATLLGLSLIWEIQLDSAHMLKEHDRKKSTAAIHRHALWLSESCMEEYTLIFHCTAAKALLTLHLHMLCIYCRNIIQGPLLQETEEYKTLHLQSNAVMRQKTQIHIKIH